MRETHNRTVGSPACSPHMPIPSRPSTRAASKLRSMGMLIALCLTGVSHASMQRHALHVTEVSSRPAVTHSHANTGKSVGSGKRVSAHASRPLWPSYRATTRPLWPHEPLSSEISDRVQVLCPLRGDAKRRVIGIVGAGRGVRLGGQKGLHAVALVLHGAFVELWVEP